MSRVNCCRACLRGSLRGLNYLLAIIGVLMMAYAVSMYHEWSSLVPPPGPPAPPAHPVPPPYAPPMPPSPPSPSVDWGGRLVSSDSFSPGSSSLNNALPRSALLRHYVDKEPSMEASRDSGGLAKYPWIIYLFGGAGAFVFATAAVGIMSADCAACGVTCFLGLYHTLMVLLLLLQVALLCFYFFDKSWEHDLPPDTTGEYAKMRGFIMHNLKSCQVAGVVTLAIQVLALVVSCSVYYAESAPRLDFAALDRYEDDIASRSSYPASQGGGGTSAALLAQRQARAMGASPRSGGAGGARHAPPGSSAWDRRMQDKYGAVDVTPGFDPEAARAAQRGDDDVVSQRGRLCTVM